MKKFLKKIYRKFGLGTADKATFLYKIHLLISFIPRKIKNNNNINGSIRLNNSKKNIAFYLSGGMGDIIISARFLNSFYASFQDKYKFDVYSKKFEVANWILEFNQGLNAIYNEEECSWELNKETYYLPIFLAGILYIDSTNFDYESIANKIPDLADFIFKLKDFYSNNKQFIVNHPFLDGYFAEKLVLLGFNRYSLPEIVGLKLETCQPEITIDENIINHLKLKKKGYITINNGFDIGFLVGERNGNYESTKNFLNYGILVKQLKEKFPELIIVHLGDSSCNKIEGVDLSLINKTSLKELAAVLKYSRLHIGNEGGLIHLAKSLNTKSCVIFGSTSEKYFGYPDNINIVSKICVNCWWMSSDWMWKCLRTQKKPLCMETMEIPEIVNLLTIELSIC